MLCTIHALTRNNRRKELPCMHVSVRSLTYSAVWANHAVSNVPLMHLLEDVPLVEFMYLVFTRMPGESYCRRLRSSVLYLCYVFRALISSLVC